MKYINYQPFHGDAPVPFYIRGIGINFQEQDITRPDGFFCAQFIMISEGNGILEAEGRTQVLNAGDVMYLPKFIPHTYRCTSGSWQSWWLIADGSGIDDLLLHLGFTETTVIRNASQKNVQRIMRGIYEMLEHDKLRGEALASAELYRLLIELHLAQRFSADSNHNAADALETAVEYMDQHYAEHITLAEIARSAGISEGYLCRLFKDFLNMRPVAYLNRLRIQKAKVLLDRSYISVEDAAAACGFENPSYFTKLFRQTEGITPSAYRNMVSI